jgi:hypothetical protein
VVHAATAAGVSDQLMDRMGGLRQLMTQFEGSLQGQVRYCLC